MEGSLGSSSLNVTFQDDPTTILGNTSKYPNGFSTPGAVTAMSASAGNPHFGIANVKMLGVYFQDDWKITHRLNIDFGVRWDRDFNLNGGATQGLDRTYLALKAVGSPFAASLPKDDTKDFSPRLGFAYDILGSGKHLIRGGYGIYFDQIFSNISVFRLTAGNQYRLCQGNEPDQYWSRRSECERGAGRGQDSLAVPLRRGSVAHDPRAIEESFCRFSGAVGGPKLSQSLQSGMEPRLRVAANSQRYDRGRRYPLAGSARIQASESQLDQLSDRSAMSMTRHSSLPAYRSWRRSK